jgi:hypothetical protein
MKAVVSKRSLRELTRKSRLPPSFQMYMAGGGLLELLTANSLEKKFRLWCMSYWVHVRPLNRNQVSITWRPNE